MPFALDVAIPIRIGKGLRRDAQHPVVEHGKNIDAGEAAARVTGPGLFDNREYRLAVGDRFLA